MALSCCSIWCAIQPPAIAYQSKTIVEFTDAGLNEIISASSIWKYRLRTGASSELKLSAAELNGAKLKGTTRSIADSNTAKPSDPKSSESESIDAKPPANSNTAKTSAEKPNAAKTEGAGSSDSKTAKSNQGTSASLEKTHGLFSAQLEKYVTDRGVNYSEWKLHPEPLKAYLHALSKIDKNEYQHLSQNEKLVFWINAYNAYTIKLVIDHYPIRGTKSYYPVSSIRQVDGFWENNSIELAGKKVTLESMEHDILRRDFLEPRTHFAVVCAAKGCGQINREAYSAARIDQQLENAAKLFLSNPKNVKIDFAKKTITVSSLFKWFPLDFAAVVGLGKRFPPPTDDEIVASYILSKAPEAASKNLSVDDSKGFKVIYEDYDWGLNDSSPVESRASGN